MKNYKIDPKKPFKDDSYNNREQFARYLKAITENTDCPTVISLNAEWGTGKTWFLNRLKHVITPCIYFSAWDEDYNDEPLAPLFSEIYNVLNIEELNWSRERLISDASTIAKHLAYNTVKLYTLDILDLESLHNEAKDNKPPAQKLIESHGELRKSIEDFIDELENAVSQLPEKRLNIIIDELDRCRPSYAIAMLERIKHIFHATGVTFILGIDHHQLANAVKGHYGENYDGKTYLERFFDYQFTLPEAPHTAIALKKFEERIDPVKSETEKFIMLKSWISNTVFFELFQPITARFVERLTERLIIVITLWADHLFYDDIDFAALLCLMSIEEPFIYRDYTTKHNAYNKTIDWIVSRARVGLPNSETYEKRQLLIAYTLIFSKGEAVSRGAGNWTGAAGGSVSISGRILNNVYKLYEDSLLDLNRIIRAINLFPKEDSNTTDG